MSDSSPGPGWWLASDGKWYPPKEADEAPGPGWWLASDGKWYPPKEADEPPGPGWWLASDGKWYAPEARANGTTTPPGSRAPAAPAAPAPQPTPEPSGQSEPKGKGKTSRRGRGGRRGRAKTDTPTPAPEVTSAAPVPPAEPEPKPKPAPRQEPAVAAGSPSTRLVTRSDVPAQDHIRPNLTEGLTPLEQIERRNQASRADASVQAARRAAAASRALGLLQAQIEIDKAEAASSAPDLTAPLAVAPTPTPVARATPAPAPTPAPADDPEPEPADDTAPLLEVKTSPLGADLEHLGDRLAIFVDRVELRDRLDRVRNSIKGDDIVDVVVNKRLTGAVLIVESIHGPGIAAKGLRPDQADEARQLILDKTRPPRLAGRTGDTDAVSPPPVASKPVAAKPVAAKPTAPATPTPPSPKVDAVALRSKLADLHKAGVLTDDEYQQKLLVVRRLASGETLRTG